MDVHSETTNSHGYTHVYNHEIDQTAKMCFIYDLYLEPLSLKSLLIASEWHEVALWIWVNCGSSNGFLIDDTQSLQGPVLIHS